MTNKKKGKVDKTIKSNKKEISELKSQIKELNDKYLRSIADFHNFQKRVEKELVFKEEETKRNIIIELLEIYELLKKAYEDNNPKQGLKLIIDNIEKFMEKEKIKPIECIGKKFDHNLHNAIATVEKKAYEDNIVVEEVKKGYTLNDKLLRPSDVIVSKSKN